MMKRGLQHWVEGRPGGPKNPSVRLQRAPRLMPCFCDPHLPELISSPVEWRPKTHPSIRLKAKCRSLCSMTPLPPSCAQAASEYELILRVSCSFIHVRSIDQAFCRALRRECRTSPHCPGGAWSRREGGRRFHRQVATAPAVRA